MATILTYDSLFEDVQSYCQRSDERFVAKIPLFIMLAQRRIANKIKSLQTKRAVTKNLTPGLPVLVRDEGWLVQESFNIAVGNPSTKRKQLYERKIEFCRSYWPDPTLTGEPLYYSSEYNINYYFFAPTPDLPYSYESIYWGTPQLIDLNYQTNIITEKYPRLLLYATLCETAPWLQDDDRSSMWQQNYSEEMATQGVEEDQRTVGVKGAVTHGS